MAVIITRTDWIDDDGSGTIGTVLNNAVKTDLYNQIDGALAKVAQLAGGNTFTSAQTINGALAVNGTVTITVNGAGLANLGVANYVAGATNGSQLSLGNDQNGAMTTLSSLSSSYSGTGPNLPNSTVLVGGGTNGLALSSTSVRMFTSNIERMRIAPTGEVSLGPGAVPSAAVQFTMVADSNKIAANTCQNLQVNSSMVMHRFVNASGGVAGDITMTGPSAIIYGTGSDQRLKKDQGPATDLAALRAVVVHDFAWKDNGARGRGVFAQEVVDLFPYAITQGDDDITDDGSLAHPWQADYSKFVPDLIVGWQQHDAELTALRAALATLKGTN